MKKLYSVILLIFIVASVNADKFDPILDTFRDQDFDGFKQLMENSFSVSERDEWGFQVIHYAVGWDWEKELEFIKYLFNKGADIESQVGKKDGQTEDDYFEYEGLTPLLLAARAGNINAVKYLIKNKRANVNYLAGGYTSAVDYAVMENHLEVVQYLLPLVKNKTVTGSIPHLNMAINHSNFELAKYLIEAGVDINNDTDDFSPLHHAVFGHSYNGEIMKMLVDRGAKVNNLNRWSDTPLHYACWDAPNATLFLIQNGAKLNGINYDGNTPLHEAAIRNNYYSIQFLLDAGADTTIKNNENKTALQIAEEKNYTQSIEVLKGTRKVGKPPYSLEDEIKSGITFTIRDNGNFTLKDLEGKTVSLSDYKGKLVFLNIWATWCPPCRYEMPDMEKVYNLLKDKGFEILAVSIDENAEDAKYYMEDNNLTFKALHDSRETVLQDTMYSSNGYPSTYIISPDGLTIHSTSGSKNWAEEKYIDFFTRFLPGTVSEKDTRNIRNFFGATAPANLSEWTGKWTANWGEIEVDMNMTQEDSLVSGVYSWKDGEITGIKEAGRNKNTITGTWKQSNTSGWFKFTLSKDGTSFTGTWGYGADGRKEGSWSGERK